MAGLKTSRRRSLSEPLVSRPPIQCWTRSGPPRSWAWAPPARISMGVVDVDGLGTLMIHPRGTFRPESLIDNGALSHAIKRVQTAWQIIREVPHVTPALSTFHRRNR